MSRMLFTSLLAATLFALGSHVAHASPITLKFYSDDDSRSTADIPNTTPTNGCSDPDICDSTLKWDVDGMIDFLSVTAKDGDVVRNVIQDINPADGGLGILGGDDDNIDGNEVLTLAFGGAGVTITDVSVFAPEHGDTPAGASLLKILFGSVTLTFNGVNSIGSLNLHQRR